MRTDCGYCDTRALRVAAFADIRPSQVIPGRRVKGGGVMARCLCCGRIWESHAKWAKKDKLIKKQKEV